MINWNTDEKAFKKNSPKEYALWRLTQLINYGLDGEKLDAREVKKAWPKIKNHLKPDNRKTIECLLWNKPWAGELDPNFDRNGFWHWYFESGLLHRKPTHLEAITIFQNAFRI